MLECEVVWAGGRGVGWQGRDGPDTGCYSVVLRHCTYQLYSHTSLPRTKLCAITQYKIQNTMNKWKPILDMQRFFVTWLLRKGDLEHKLTGDKTLLRKRGHVAQKMKPGLRKYSPVGAEETGGDVDKHACIS